MPITVSGSCQALREIAELQRIAVRVDWPAENAAKQLQFEAEREKWRAGRP
jgi:hypothetical protein